jgi:hypothetical protein
MAREIAAQYSKAERFQTWTHDYLMQRLMELVTVSAAAEREACAKEDMDKDETSTEAAGAPAPYGLAGITNISEDLSTISFVRGPRFQQGMTDTILCGVGTLTAGEYMRKTLHVALDRWIDDNLGTTHDL